MKTPSPHKNITARMKCTGENITRPLSSWLAECERHDGWHELPARDRKPTKAKVARFLRDYDFTA